MANADPGVVDQHVQAADKPVDLGESPVDRVAVGNVRHHGAGQAGQLPVDAIACGSLAVDDDDPRLLLEESGSGGGPDPAGAARDHRPLSPQAPHHGWAMLDGARVTVKEAGESLLQSRPMRGMRTGGMTAAIMLLAACGTSTASCSAAPGTPSVVVPQTSPSRL